VKEVEAVSLSGLAELRTNGVPREKNILVRWKYG